MRFALAVTGVAFLCALSPGVADAARHSTCAKPARGMHIGFKQGKVKLLQNYGADGQSLWYLCKAGLKRPKRWFEAPGYGLETQDEEFRLSGNRITFYWFLDDGEGDYYAEVGFLDVRTAKRQAVEIDTEHVTSYVVGANNTVAWVEGSGAPYSQAIGWAKLPGKARFLTDVPEGNVKSKTLRLTSTGVEWKTRDGQTQSVLFTYKPPEWQYIRDFPIPTKKSEPTSIIAGPDGALWFTEYAGNKIGRIAVDGVLTEFKVPTTRSRPDVIVAGADGALWFTEGAGNKIGRITTAGQITEFKVPTAKSEPRAITAGPDGALWFIEGATNKVGRITVDGQITEFKAKSRNLALTGMTTGPDGAIWFGANAGGGDYAQTQRIERMTLDGKVTGEFELADYVDAAAVLTAGPDGAVWFTEPGSGQIGRIAGDGSIKVSKTRSQNGAPTGITAGQDGALWYSDQSSNKLGRMLPDGTLTEYRLPTPAAGPFWITPGPDNALWFTEYDKNRIGRISLDVSRPAPTPTQARPGT